MSNRMLHPRWCAPGCQVTPDHPTRSHVSRPIMITACGQEVLHIRVVLSMAHTPMGAPLLLLVDTYDTDPEVKQPVSTAPLSIRQAGDLSRGITGLLRLAQHTTWCDQPSGQSQPLFTHLAEAQRGLTDEEIAQFLSMGRKPDLFDLGDDQ